MDTTRCKSLWQCGIRSKPLLCTDSDYRHHDFAIFATPSKGIGEVSGASGGNDDGDDAPAAPVPRWHYPHFDILVDTIRSHVTKDRSGNKPRQDEVYSLKDGFLPEDRGWIDRVRAARMYAKSKVLYRPDIVHDLVERIEEVLASKKKIGLDIQGLQGVGKSHSIINLTRYLLASGKFWVTIIPDCHKWLDEHDFFKFLLQSVGVDLVRFRLSYDASIDPSFEMLIHDIDSVLSENGMQWVFVFDQINAIFARDYCNLIEDVNDLEFPFSLIYSVPRQGRIISIISASANNDVSHRGNHEGFDVFEHPTQLDVDEINLLYPSEQVLQWDWEEVEYLTGRVPLYLHRWAKDPDKYSSDIHNEIEFSLSKLEEEKRGKVWECIKKSAIQCLLCTSCADPPLHLDRKFSMVKRDRVNDRYRIVALFPLVEEGYRDFFWNDLVRYIQAR